ncbi:MAG: SdrD B-like domain-containing protein [Planctomycetia bacterium]|nr:SdrD B-like domain-containing protein [Planctomycetia bacterium]
MKSTNIARMGRTSDSNLDALQKTRRGLLGLRKKGVTAPDLHRRLRVELLEKRELLAADPISTGVVYVEQGASAEAEGDKFTIAWVGGETAGGEQLTTLSAVTINLDKNGNHELDSGELYFNDEGTPVAGIKYYAPFTVIDCSEGIKYDVRISDDKMSLELSFENFKAGDIFSFTIDVDEYQTEDAEHSTSLAEGSEMGGSIAPEKSYLGSWVSMTFLSEHYQTVDYNGMFVDDYDHEYTRPESLTEAYGDRLPYDTDFDGNGISSAGTYAQLTLTPKPIIISGHVYADFDVDCNLDETDELIAGVEVTLVSKSGDTWTTETDANGYYEFGVDEQLMPGEYDIYSQTNVAGPGGTTYYDFCAKGGDFAEKVTPIHINVSDEIQGGERSDNNNFSKVLPGSISGYVFEDLNDKNNKEAGESGLDEITVDLYKLVDGEYVHVATTKTDANGFYEFGIAGQYGFNDIRLNVNGTYLVREGVVPVEYTDGKDYIGTLGGETNQDEFTDIYVGFNEHGVNYNFGELKLGSIAGNVFEDRNDNGIFDDGEAGIGSVLIELYVADGSGKYVLKETTRTSADGSYQFDNLDITLDYAVKEAEQPDGYSDGKDHIGTLGGALENDYISQITVNWDEHGEQYDFGELKRGSLAGNVYEDLNDNGIFDPDEKGIEKVVVQLYYWDGTDYQYLRSTKTAGDGSYQFDNLDINLEYAIREIQPEDYLDGKDTIGSLGGKVSDDYFSEILVLWDEHGVEYNFGELPKPDPATISGHVFLDANDNGVFDDDEVGISNVTLTLWVKDIQTSEYVLCHRTTVSNKAGYYEFAALTPGETYRVTETQPTEYRDGQDHIGTLGGQKANDDLYDITVSSGDFGRDYDFGELPPETPPDPDPTPGGYIPYRKIEAALPSRAIGGPANPYHYTYRQPTISPSTVSFFGGGGLPASYSWHLSVVDGGYPRSIEALGATVGFRSYLNTSQYQNVSFEAENMQQGQWLIRGNDGSVAARYQFGTDGAFAIVGDWNGDGTDSIGVYREGKWYLDRDGDGDWDADDLWAELGSKKDQPVAGDWDGDGKSDIGVFGPQWAGDPLAISTEPGLPADSNSYVNVSRPKNVPPEFNGATFGHRVLKHRSNPQVRLDLIDHVFEYGNEGDKAVTGDWNGDGVSKIGVYRGGKWFLDVNGNGRWDSEDVYVEDFGGKDSLPVVADFNHDGIDEIGTFAAGRWDLDTNGDYEPDVYFTFGQEGDQPVVGDFNGDGNVQFGVYRAANNEASGTQASQESPESVQVAMK